MTTGLRWEMRNKIIILMVMAMVAASAIVLSLTNSIWAQEEVSPAVADAGDTSRKLDSVIESQRELAETQKTIMEEIKSIKEEIEIIKIRVTQNQ